MSMATRIAKMRLHFHASACDWNNVLNQLHVISDEKAEIRNKNHVMTIMSDILPRLGYDTEAIFTKKQS